MHELSIIENILKIVTKTAEENNLKSATQVTISVGKLRQVIPEFLEFAFKSASNGTIAENAKLIVNIIPIKIYCTSCNKISEVEENIYLCPLCQSSNVELHNGKEIVLENIEGTK